MSTIETTSGSVTTRGRGSLDVTVFFRRNPCSAESVLFDAEKDKLNEIKGIGGAEVVPSSKTVTGKKWVTKRNEYPDGSFIRIELRKLTKAVGFAMRVHNVVLRARSTGPLHELRIECPTDDNSSVSAVYVIGRYDILPVDEIDRLDLDVDVNGNSNLDRFEAIDDISFVTVTQKEREIVRRQPIKAQTIATKSGNKIIPKLVVRRRINLNK